MENAMMLWGQDVEEIDCFFMKKVFNTNRSIFLISLTLLIGVLFRGFPVSKANLINHFFEFCLCLYPDQTN